MPCQPAHPTSVNIWALSVVPDVYHYTGPHLPQQINQTSLAAECALAIGYNGLDQAVMTASPEGIEDFVRGFSLSNGFVQTIDEIYEIRVGDQSEFLHTEVEISSRASWSLERQRWQLTGTSGYGLCNVEALEQALSQLPEQSPQALPSAARLDALCQRVEQAQRLVRHNGALHAALYSDGRDELRLRREDISRRNALDKLIGALHRQGLDAAQGFVVATSRCSLGFIHKVVRAGIDTLVNLFAPTALTAQWAHRHQLSLIRQSYHSTPRAYSPAPAAAE